MRALILSDIHSNLEALTAVLDNARDRGGFHSIWCLADMVWYEPDPGPCIEMSRRHDLTAVAGNHDCVAMGKASADNFNHGVKTAVLWTATQPSADEAGFLAGLPTVVAAACATEPPNMC